MTLSLYNDIIIVEISGRRYIGRKKKKNSDAKIRANNKYTKRAYKSIIVRFKPKEYDALSEAIRKAKAKDKNVTRNGFIVSAVKEKIEKESGTGRDEDKTD